MTRQKTALRITTAAIAAAAAFGAHAQEATQWVPEHMAAVTTADATATPNAWTTTDVAATQFHDGMSRDTMTTRESVKAELRQARERHLLNDSGEGGASDRVLAAREAFIEEEHDRLVAQYEQEAAMAALIESVDVQDDWMASSYETAGFFEYAPASVTVYPMDEPSFPLDGDPYMVSSLRTEEEYVSGLDLEADTSS